MGFVTILRNKLHGTNNVGSGPQGKYMVGDVVDETMEPIDQLDRWIAGGVAEASDGPSGVAAAERGQAFIDEQAIVTRKARAENQMSIYDELEQEERDAAKADGDEAVEDALAQPKRKRGRPRKDAQAT